MYRARVHLRLSPSADKPFFPPVRLSLLAAYRICTFSHSMPSNTIFNCGKGPFSLQTLCPVGYCGIFACLYSDMFTALTTTSQHYNGIDSLICFFIFLALSLSLALCNISEIFPISIVVVLCSAMALFALPSTDNEVRNKFFLNPFVWRFRQHRNMGYG